MPPVTPKSTVAVIGHRGSGQQSTHPPHAENTLAAFAAAVAAWADVLEADVRVSRDGVAVLAHDAKTKRCFGVPGTISGRDWTELAKLRSIVDPARRKQDCCPRTGPGHRGEEGEGEQERGQERGQEQGQGQQEGQKQGQQQDGQLDQPPSEGGDPLPALTELLALMADGPAAAAGIRLVLDVKPQGDADAVFRAIKRALDAVPAPASASSVSSNSANNSSSPSANAANGPTPAAPTPASQPEAGSQSCSWSWPDRITIGIWTAPYLASLVRTLPGFRAVAIGPSAAYASRLLDVPAVAALSLHESAYVRPPWARRSNGQGNGGRSTATKTGERQATTTTTTTTTVATDATAADSEEVAIVAAAHARGKRVYVWTVNDPAVIRWALREARVDGVVSDMVPLCRELVDAHHLDAPLGRGNETETPAAASAGAAAGAAAGVVTGASAGAADAAATGAAHSVNSGTLRPVLMWLLARVANAAGRLLARVHRDVLRELVAAGEAAAEEKEKNVEKGKERGEKGGSTTVDGEQQPQPQPQSEPAKNGSAPQAPTQTDAETTEIREGAAGTS